MLGLLVLLLCIVRYAETGDAAFLVACRMRRGTADADEARTDARRIRRGSGCGSCCVGVPARNLRREVTLFGVPALAVPTVVYGALSTAVSPRDLLLENLYPVDMLRAGGDRLMDVRMPLTFSSLVERGRKTRAVRDRCRRDCCSLPVHSPRHAGAARPSSHAPPARRWSSSPPLRSQTSSGSACTTCGAGFRRLRCRRGLRRLPALRRRDGVWSARSQLEFATVIALAVVAFTTLRRLRLQRLAAADGRVLRTSRCDLRRAHPPGRVRPEQQRRTLGVVWVGFLAAALIGLTMHGHRTRPSRSTALDGALAAAPSDGGGLPGGGRCDRAEHRSRRTDLRRHHCSRDCTSLTGRPSPLGMISTLPPALPSSSDQLAAIERLDEAGVRLAVIDNAKWIGYGHSSSASRSTARLRAGSKVVSRGSQVIRGTGDEPTST